jgi:putative transposase
MRETKRIKLEAEEIEALEKIARKKKETQQLAQRARMVLWLSEGKTIKATAGLAGAKEETVATWKKRWLEGEIGGLSPRERLKDKDRCGAPAKYEAKQIAGIIGIACEKPSDCGRPISRWSLREIRKEAIKRGIVKDVSPKSISRFLKGGGSSASQNRVLDQHAKRN